MISLLTPSRVARESATFSNFMLSRYESLQLTLLRRLPSVFSIECCFYSDQLAVIDHFYLVALRFIKFDAFDIFERDLRISRRSRVRLLR